MSANRQWPANEVENQTPVGVDVARYIALTFGFSWITLIGAIKLALGEEYLNVGIAGPAVAALILSKRRPFSRLRISASRALWFVVLLVLCWIVLSLNYEWRNHSDLQFQPDAFLLFPAALPAWILSGIFSAEEGVRSLVRRLVHAPDRWSLYALLYFPILLGIPSLIAYAFHARLVFPKPADRRWQPGPRQ